MHDAATIGYSIYVSFSCHQFSYRTSCVVQGNNQLACPELLSSRWYRGRWFCSCSYRSLQRRG